MRQFFAWSKDRRQAIVSGIEQHWPLPNVWLGVSVENQRMADERIPVLLDTPAVVRFLSCEPLLGPLDLRKWLKPPVYSGDDGTNSYQWPPLNWVIVGGESGPGSAERKLVERCVCLLPDRSWNKDECTFCGRTGWRPKPQAIRWVRSLRDQAVAAGVAYHFKQWGGPKPTSGARLLDGRTWDEMPGVAA